MSFAAKIAYQTALVYDIRANVKGHDAFYILQVDKARHSAFKQAMAADGPLDITAYGEILHYDFGEPSDALKAELREKFGMYEDHS